MTGSLALVLEVLRSSSPNGGVVVVYIKYLVRRRHLLP